MKLIARESYKRKGDYPFYTLAMADYHHKVGDVAFEAMPIIICQYDNDLIQVFTYEDMMEAKNTFCLLCDVPGLRNSLA